jgi:tricarballylate dehydrogenase
MTAQETGANVLLLESAPKDLRGGNSRHTRNLRYLHDSGNDYLTGSYHEDEFWEDLLRVTGGQTNESLAHLTNSNVSGKYSICIHNRFFGLDPKRTTYRNHHLRYP